jgi:hypothetical protein
VAYAQYGVVTDYVRVPHRLPSYGGCANLPACPPPVVYLQAEPPPRSSTPISYHFSVLLSLQSLGLPSHPGLLSRHLSRELVDRGSVCAPRIARHGFPNPGRRHGQVCHFPQQLQTNKQHGELQLTVHLVSFSGTGYSKLGKSIFLRLTRTIPRTELPELTALRICR